MDIALCDNDPNTLNGLHTAIMGHSRRRAHECNLQFFPCVQALLDRLGQGYRPCLLFLAIGEHGLAEARAIRAIAQNCVLVLMASTPDYSLEGYSVHAYSYLIKPIQRESIVHILDSIGERGGRSIEVRANGMPVLIPCCDILYLESDKHHILVHTANRLFRTLGKLDDYEKQVDGSRTFLRCHQSFLVNMAYVREVQKNSFVLMDGTGIPIRKAGAAHIRSLYLSYETSVTQQSFDSAPQSAGD